MGLLWVRKTPLHLHEHVCGVPAAPAAHGISVALADACHVHAQLLLNSVAFQSEICSMCEVVFLQDEPGWKPRSTLSRHIPKMILNGLHLDKQGSAVTVKIVVSLHASCMPSPISHARLCVPIFQQLFTAVLEGTPKLCKVCIAVDCLNPVIPGTGRQHDLPAKGGLRDRHRAPK